VAKLDPDMWTTLFAMNRGPLLQEINTLLENLTTFRDALAADDRPQVRALLDRGRALREAVLLRQHQVHAGDQ
jgi:prephenate dehydrogenase